MKATKICLALLIAAPIIAIPGLAQNPGETKPSFEVASVKANTSVGCLASIVNRPGGRFVATCLPLRVLITNAYHIQNFQIIGAPGWIADDRWNIEARVGEESIPPRVGAIDDPTALRLQSLMEDQFKLKFHRETRELPAYELTIAKSGIKINKSEDQSPYMPLEKGDSPTPPIIFRPGDPIPHGAMRLGIGELEANAIDISSLIQTLSKQLRRSVIDKTGLKGRYDIKLKWSPEMGQVGNQAGTPFGQPSESSGPSIFTAVQEQLGLKIESTKGPTEVFVIDSVRKPSEN
jgi:uncharacterized protein (TIGR03435 family)